MSIPAEIVLKNTNNITTVLKPTNVSICEDRILFNTDDVNVEFFIDKSKSQALVYARRVSPDNENSPVLVETVNFSVYKLTSNRFCLKAFPINATSWLIAIEIWLLRQCLSLVLENPISFPNPLEVRNVCASNFETLPKDFYERINSVCAPGVFRVKPWHLYEEDELKQNKNTEWVIKGPVVWSSIFKDFNARNAFPNSCVPLIKIISSPVPIFPAPFQQPTIQSVEEGEDKTSHPPYFYHITEAEGVDLLDILTVCSSDLVGTLESLHMAIKLMELFPPMWASNIYHGDISAENIIITEEKEVKLIDWDYSHGGNWPLRIRGKVYTVDPAVVEIINADNKDLYGSYDPTRLGDYWSLGVTLFCWVFGFKLYDSLADSHFIRIFEPLRVCHKRDHHLYNSLQYYLPTTGFFAKRPDFVVKLCDWFQAFLVLDPSKRKPLGEMIDTFVDMVGQFELETCFEKIQLDVMDTISLQV